MNQGTIEEDSFFSKLHNTFSQITLRECSKSFDELNNCKYSVDEDVSKTLETIMEFDFDETTFNREWILG